MIRHLTLLFFLSLLFATHALGCGGDKPLRREDIVRQRYPSAGEEKDYEKALETFKNGDYLECFERFEAFSVRFPTSPKIREAIAYEMESAKMLASVGHERSFIGISTGKSPTKGLTLLKESLIRHPNEDTSDNMYMWMGNFYFTIGDTQSAIDMYSMVVKEYPRSEHLGPAIYQTGRAYLYQFKSVKYDTKMLKDARRQFQRYISEFKGEQNYKNAQYALRYIDEQLSAHDMMVAEYYLFRGQPKSAAVYYELIITEYPQTSRAAWAKKKLEELQRTKKVMKRKKK